MCVYYLPVMFSPLLSSSSFFLKKEEEFLPTNKNNNIKYTLHSIEIERNQINQSSKLKKKKKK